MTKKTEVIEVQQLDNGIKLFFYIKKDSLTEPIDGSVVHLKLMEKTKKRVLNRKCVITDPELAECLYVLTSEDLKIDGLYDTEIQVDYANGTILSLDNVFKLNVVPEVIPRQDMGRQKEIVKGVKISNYRR